MMHCKLVEPPERDPGRTGRGAEVGVADGLVQPCSLGFFLNAFERGEEPKATLMEPVSSKEALERGKGLTQIEIRKLLEGVKEEPVEEEELF